MGKKGAKRKTRWRTLSIGTPPGEEDEEEGSRNGFLKQNGEHQQQYPGSGRERNGYAAGWLKSRHGSAGSSGSGSASGSANGNGGGSTTSGYASGGSRSRRDDSSESPRGQQPPGKIVFNEEEYTRITTPRQDVLFKKGYLSKRKPWASTTSMSATPSTAESQSASHSTADGSEAAEDQQLLDAGGAGEFLPAPALEAAPQLSYGTYYDHASGYYYEYPMMLVGPALPDQMGPNVLAAMPCAPVPLRPIEWVNPAFVPKLASQQYCYMDYQAAQPPDYATMVDEQGVPILSGEASLETSLEASLEASLETPLPLRNGISNGASLTGSGVSGASISGSASATGSVADEPLSSPVNGQEPAPLEEAELGGELGAEALTEAPTTLAVEPEEDMEQPMEYAEATTFMPAQPVHMPHVIPQPLAPPAYVYPGQYMFGPPVLNVNGVTIQSGPMLRCSDMEASTAAAASAKRRRKKKKRKQKRPHALGNSEEEDEEEYSSEGETGLPGNRVSWSTTAAPAPASAGVSKRPLNPECQEFQPAQATATATEPQGPGRVPARVPARLSMPGSDDRRLSDSQEAAARGNGLVANGLSAAAPPEEAPTESHRARRKFSGKFAREPTPGPDLDASADAPESDASVEQLGAALATAVIHEVQTSKKDGELDICESWLNESSFTSESCYNENNESASSTTLTTTATTTTTAAAAAAAAATATATADEDSGFESQSKLGVSSRPITEAVSQWLKRANSPDLFITYSVTSDEEVEEEEDPSLSNEPSKNLQSNPMPALSVSGCAAERLPTPGEFAKSTGPAYISDIPLKQNEIGTSSTKSTSADSSNDKKRAKALALANDGAETSPGNLNAKKICELVRKDSDVGVRVAENSRISVRSRRTQEERRERLDEMQSVRTYEKGEIVVSLDGELLLVTERIVTEPAVEEREEEDKKSVHSLGSIEEPDVLECWEAETVEPLVNLQTTLLAEKLSEEDVGFAGMEHVQRYYRLQADSNSVKDVDLPSDDGISVSSASTSASNTPVDACSTADELPAVIEVRGTSIGFADAKLPPLMVDEAFEVYESCYTGKPLPFTPIDAHFGKFGLFTRDQERPVPCRPVCCIIQ